MLVSYPNAYMPVGVAVSQWTVNGNLRTFVMFPFTTSDGDYVEVDCATEEDGQLQILSRTVQDWGPIKNGFGDNAEGYAYDKQTAKNLYKVWDNGVGKEFKPAQELYSSFEHLIDACVADANNYLMKITSESYEQELAKAKKCGWDTSLVQKHAISFPYLHDAR